ncbi:MAG: DUF58 domain-containing protein [Lachnospiraceae bacterium]|nr:DUF58 domain-containing protein [Lachnospiraceae bacterium]
MNIILFSIFVLACILCGFLTGSGLLLILPLVMLISLGISFLLVKKAVKQMDLKLTAPAVTGKRKDFSVELQVNQKSPIPVGGIRFNLVCKNKLTGMVFKEYFPDGFQSVRLTEQYCGCLDLYLENIRISDWMGILSVKYKDPVSCRVLVMPDTFSLETSPHLAISNLMDAEEYSQFKKGQDRQETFQIREYVPGDSLQQIHWKLSSKMDKLMVRDASLPMDPSLMLFWDKKKTAADVADCLCESFVSLAHAFSEAGVTYRMAWNGENIHMADVHNIDQLPEAIAELLKTDEPEDSLSGAGLYAATHGQAEAARILYLTGNLTEDVSLLSSTSDIHVLYCSNGTAAEETEEGIPVVHFTPQNFEQELQDFCLE